MDTMWTGDMMDMGMGLLYFYDNGTWAESRGEECSLDETLSIYECNFFVNKTISFF